MLLRALALHVSYTLGAFVPRKTCALRVFVPHVLVVFFSIWVFFQEHSRITGLQRKGEGIPLTPHYHFHTLYRHLDISRVVTADSSPLDIASSPTQTANLLFPRASR